MKIFQWSPTILTKMTISLHNICLLSSEPRILPEKCPTMLVSEKNLKTAVNIQYIQTNYDDPHCNSIPSSSIVSTLYSSSRWN